MPGFCLRTNYKCIINNLISDVRVSSGASSEKNVGNSGESTNEPSSNVKSEAPVESEVDPEPHRIRLMSWNIDGLEQNCLVDRTKEVCAIIQK